MMGELGMVGPYLRVWKLGVTPVDNENKTSFI
jgi:hypothetical protein